VNAVLLEHQQGTRYTLHTCRVLACTLLRVWFCLLLRQARLFAVQQLSCNSSILDLTPPPPARARALSPSLGAVQHEQGISSEEAAIKTLRGLEA